MSLLVYFLDPGKFPKVHLKFPRAHLKFVNRPRPVILQIVFMLHHSTSPNAIPGGFEVMPRMELHNREEQRKGNTDHSCISDIAPNASVSRQLINARMLASCGRKTTFVGSVLHTDTDTSAGLRL
jgi:hypothetical protein